MIRKQQKDKKKLGRHDSMNTSQMSYDESGQTTFFNAGFTVNSPGTSGLGISQHEFSQPTPSPQNLRFKKGKSFIPTSKRLLEKSQTVSNTLKKEASMFVKMDANTQPVKTDYRPNETTDNASSPFEVAPQLTGPSPTSDNN